MIWRNRSFEGIDQLQYGETGLSSAKAAILDALQNDKRIALYADYDVDGTMSCVSWSWFLKAIGYNNFIHYIPCRFKEGYGLNLDAIKHLIHDKKADVIITMDTGITANVEAAYCKEQGVEFICTDHHVIQTDKMPDCIILNPKQHPDPRYQELCGCGITFVLLRNLASEFDIDPALWTDLLALCGMATICDLVPLNGVNHKLAKMGVQALLKSERPVLRELRKACSLEYGVDEQDVGFRIGPRINAVGRLEHADMIVKAFLEENFEPLIQKMSQLNDERKAIQSRIVEQAHEIIAPYVDDPILFVGHQDWHPGVVGIVASGIAESYWRPTWIFQKSEDVCKGSARSIPRFDVTKAMQSAGSLWEKFGGHQAAGGYSFLPENEEQIREALTDYAMGVYEEDPDMWESSVQYDCKLPVQFLNLDTVESLESLKPYGMGFEQPSFMVHAPIVGVQFYNDKQTGKPKHTACEIGLPGGQKQKVMFFNEVHRELEKADYAKFILKLDKNYFRGKQNLSLFGIDYSIESMV